MASQAVTERPQRTAADILGSGNKSVVKSQATTVEQSRAVTEVQAAVVVAQSHPRDKSRALNEALESCRTREVAESAFFKFNRGGGSVAGETIHLARELARCWGNIDYKISELDRDDEKGSSEMLAVAWDLETNARSSLTFIVPHLRDKKGGAVRLTDVRDIYENNANMGARRLRECIFAVLPPYLVKSAADECRNTLERGESEEPITVRVSKLLSAFAQIGIDKARIEAKLGPVDRFTPVDLANVRIAYQSIKRGEILADDEFPRIEGAAPVASKLDAFENAVTGNDGALGDDNLGAGEGRDDADTGELFDAESPADAKVREIKVLIAAAPDIDALGTVMTDNRKHLAGLGEDRTNDVWAEHGKRKHALMGGKS